MKQKNKLFLASLVICLVIMSLSISILLTYTARAADGGDLGPVGRSCQTLKSECESTKDAATLHANSISVQNKINEEGPAQSGTCWTPGYECGDKCKACNIECEKAYDFCNDKYLQIQEPPEPKGAVPVESPKGEALPGDAIALGGLGLGILQEVRNKGDGTTPPPTPPPAAEKTQIEKDLGWFKCPQMKTLPGNIICWGVWALSITRGIELGWDISRGKGTCSVEKPYPDMVTARCRSCNEDPYRICTKERCEILGKCVALKKENFSSPNIVGFDASKDINYECIPGECKNYGLVAFKVINATWALSDGTTSSDYTEQVEYRTAPSNLTLNLNEIEYNTKVMNITVTTDQLARCRYIIDKAGAKFEEMTDFDNNEYPNNGGTEMKPIPQSALILFAGDLTRDENHTIFIKCSNVCPDKGGIHNQYYDHNQVKFKFKPKPDSLWPAITFLDPQNNAVISNEWPRLNVSIWLDENGVCYYAAKNRNWNITLSNMTKMGEGRTWKPDPYYTTEDTPVIQTRCIQDENCTDLRKDICTHCFMELDLKKGFDEINWSVLPQDYQNQLDQMGLYNTTKMFRISLRCQDASQQKNTMPEEEALNYIIMTMPPYNITIITPENDSKTYNLRPEIQVTSGSRNTQCKYLTSTKTNLIPQWDKMTFIDEEASTTHSGIHNETLEGGNYPGKAYTIYALCRDEWNMESRATAHFSVIADTKAPILIRTYHDAVGGSFLILETDEISTCAYTYDRCNFNFSQGALMIGENQTIHSAYWGEKTLFIKCQDEYGNFPTSAGYTKDPTYPWCTAMLRPFEIPSISR